MPPVTPHPLLDQLAALRAGLIDDAFILDREGNLVAADVAMTIAARLAELHAHFNPTTDVAPPSPQAAISWSPPLLRPCSPPSPCLSA